MNPTDFYSFVFPLGVLIVILVSLSLFLSRKEDMYEKELKRLRRERAKQEKIFAEELEKLQTLLHDKLIDQDTYARLRRILEMGLTRRVKRINAMRTSAQLLAYYAAKCPYCKRRIFVPKYRQNPITFKENARASTVRDAEKL